MADWRTHSPGQRSEVWLADASGGAPTLLFETAEMLVEAPNWSLDGSSLYLNGDGRLWRLDVADPSGLHEVVFEGLPALNNDHVLSRDGRFAYMSASDGHIYRGALTGGPVTRISPDDGLWHFLHGVTSDQARMAYVEISTFDQPGRLIVAPTDQSAGSRVDTGPSHIDGPEWDSADEWIYFNTEGFTVDPGHAQIARIRDGGGPVERLVTSDAVDWFPHPSPDGASATYISFPSGTQGHPADLDVSVTLVRTSDWSTPVAVYPVFGGQGTLNVNSWSPAGDRFAFVAYPVGAPTGR